MSDWLDFLGSEDSEGVTRNRRMFVAAHDAVGFADDRLEARAEKHGKRKKRKKQTSAWWYVAVTLGAVAFGFIAYAVYVEFGYMP